ncbi:MULTISPECIES: hypothetical protein [Corallococcus]|uniref:hypothetical protein n=1 Tax=Corallococcus TaxID=83461 RepID=UPI00131585CB|nr:MULTISPECIES: hypothetical protein [Corallococcus]
MSDLIIKRAELHQGIISRMAQNSFAIKGWAVTVITALLAFGNKDTERYFAVLAVYPTVVFWGLDSYFLMKERQFRGLPVQLIASGEELSLVVPPASVKKYFEAVWAWTVWPIYVGLLFVVGILVGA